MIDWENVCYFSRGEFVDDIDDNLDPRVIDRLDILRAVTGSPIHPSPVSGSCVRFDGSKTSRHYAVGRKSTAVDVFSECDPIIFLKVLRIHKLFNGIGIYYDTYYDGRPHIMFHLDLRSRQTVWSRDGKYTWGLNIGGLIESIKRKL